MSEVRETKRRCKVNKDKVLIEIPNHLILKQFLDVLVKLLSDVHFQLIHDPPNFTGLEVATLNNSKSCMIQARFVSMVSGDISSISSFCVAVDTLSTCLEFAEPNQSVTLCVDQEYVRFDVIQANGMLNGTTVHIPRKISFQKPFRYDMEFNYVIKMKQNTFRKNMKNLKSLKVDRVEFCIYRPKNSEESTTIRPRTQSLYFAFRGDGDLGTACVWFYSATKVSESSLPSDSEVTEKHKPESYRHTYVTVEEIDLPPPNTDMGLSYYGNRNTPNMDDMEQLYRQIYPLLYLEYFTKNLDRNDVTFHMTTGFPLLVNYPVGDRSYIRFVLMRLMDDSDPEIDVMNPNLPTV